MESAVENSIDVASSDSGSAELAKNIHNRISADRCVDSPRFGNTPSGEYEPAKPGSKKSATEKADTSSRTVLAVGRSKSFAAVCGCLMKGTASVSGAKYVTFGCQLECHDVELRAEADCGRSYVCADVK